MISSKLHFVTLFVLILFCSNILPQDKNIPVASESEFKTLEYLQKRITEWKAKDFKNIYADQILDTISQFAANRPKLLGLYQKAYKRFRSQMERLNQQIKSQQSIDAVDFAYEHISNKITFDDRYYYKFLNISGVICNIDRDEYGSVFVLLNPGIKCIFSGLSEYEVNSLSVGDLPVIRGKYTGAVPRGNGEYLMIIENCHVVKEADLTKQQKQIWKGVESFVSSFAFALNDEIKLLRARLVESIYNLGQVLSEQKDYSAAITELRKIGLYTDSSGTSEKSSQEISDKARELIERLGYQISYDKAQKLIGDGDFLNAYLTLVPPAFNAKGFENSLDLFRECFTRFYEERIRKASLKGSMEEYMAAFDSLAKYSQYDVKYFQDLIGKWQSGFSEFAKSHYKGDIRKYKTVPGGSYIDSLTGKQVEVGSILISNIEIDRQFQKAFRYSTSGDMNQRLTSQPDKEDKRRITQWLGLRFLTPEESEYIETDGWKSRKEKDLFCSGLVNYGVKAGPKTLCISLNDVENPDNKKYLSDVIERQRAQIKENISKEKEMAYSVSKVPEFNRLYIMPRISYLYMFNDWNFNQDIRLYQKGGDLAFGMFIGYNFKHDMSRRFHPFNGIGLNIQYITNTSSSNGLYPLNSKVQMLDINTYKHNGFEAEFQYRALLMTNSVVLGLGYIQMKSEYSFRFKGETSAYSANENISAISTTLGLSINEFTDMSILLFMKSYFSTKPEGQYSFSSKLSGNFVLGISLDYQIPFLRYEP